MKRLRYFFAATFVALSLSWCANAWAQISVSLAMERDEFIVYETMHLEISLTNYSARPIRLEAPPGKSWLEIQVTRPNGEMIPRAGTIELDAVTIPSGQTVSRRVNLVEAFQIRAPGRYSARVRVTAPGVDVQAATRPFTVASGLRLWEETVGIEVLKGTSETEEQFRTYSLLQFTAKGGIHVLYVQVEDKQKELIYGVIPLGVYLPFVKPQARIDKQHHLHLLFQSGSRQFSYLQLSPNAQVIEFFTLTNHFSVPNLTVTADGKVVVMGGERLRAE